MGAGNPCLAAFKFHFQSLFGVLEISVRIDGFFGQFSRAIQGRVIGGLVGGGCPPIMIRIKLLFARGEVPSRIFQCIEQGQDFFDAGITHNLF